MKNFAHILSFLFVLSSPLSSLKAQIVTIPDSVFKAILVADTVINSNQDTEIQVSEALNYTGAINVYNAGIADLTGIEAFTNLTSLDCGNNLLTTLDLSMNTALMILYCNNNQLTALDLSNNLALTELSCFLNQLTAINLSNNTALTAFFCYNNLLTSLDLSNNSLLVKLFCQDNQLSSLNVQNGNNTNFTHFNAISNPNLTCIQVDSVAYSIAYWDHIDQGATFSVNCFTNILAMQKDLTPFSAYPNPCHGKITLDFGQSPIIATITIRNTLGQLLNVQQALATTQLEIEFPDFKGLLYCTISSLQGEYTIPIWVH